MTSDRQDKAFVEYLISSALLEDAIDWVKSNMEPEDVFSTQQLSEWAINSDFVKVEI